jgi:hypothetical protein
MQYSELQSHTSKRRLCVDVIRLCHNIRYCLKMVYHRGHFCAHHSSRRVPADRSHRDTHDPSDKYSALVRVPEALLVIFLRFVSTRKRVIAECSATYVVVFQLNLAAVRALVLPPRHKGHKKHNDNIKQRRSNASVYARVVVRLVCKPVSIPQQFVRRRNDIPCSLKTRPPAIPPTPPIPTSVAEQKARFHCPRMLFAW